MTNRFSVYFILLFPAFFSCSRDNSEIRVACERNPKGDYLLKWETYPLIDGTVKIYQSSDPESFVSQNPITEQDIKTGYAIVASKFLEPRQYFKLVFNKKQSVVTAERAMPTDGVYNFRDVGGYYTKDKSYIKWGKLYRSSSMYNATPGDVEILDDLKIKSMTDLRTNREIDIAPPKYRSSQVFNIPIESENLNSFINKITFEEMKKGDILIALQDGQMEMLHKNKEQLIRIFDMLLDGNNYPVLIYCTWGKDKASLVIALILAALDIPYDQIVEDYMLSNKYTNFNFLIPDGDLYETSVQEVLTVLLSSHEEVINYLFDQINKEFGSVNNYLEKELLLTSKKREKLKNLLLNKESE
ncbi:MAG: tyrosine-protein phosphatase [Dysgonamonadaceae bacterium]|jgi:protein-tyrosine phosphatase|nr:tyrosine-protein phosphatase [Dysgonamonadaceae bacterium]